MTERMEKLADQLKSEIEVETGNMQGVAVQGDSVIVLMPRQRMTRSEAMTHAAWLVALSGGRDMFLEVLDAVEAT